MQIVHSQKFVCDIYVNGDRVNRCKVWVSQGSYSDGILFSNGGYAIDNDDSYNERIRVDDDGHDLFLKPDGFYTYGYSDENKLDANGAAEHLWEKFVEPLER